MPAKRKSARIASLRREYEGAKRAYRKSGRKALGKRATSPAYKEYVARKREYKRLGRALGAATGRKPRRGR